MREPDSIFGNAKGAYELMTNILAQGLDFTQSWGEAREYAFTTHCLLEPETREHWLQRVKVAELYVA